MARKRGAHRYRRGRFQALTRLLCLLLIAAAMVAALTLFFKAERIDVEGNRRYTADEIVAASGIGLGDNLFLLNKIAAAERICAALPYVESAAIRRALPDALRITVTECRAAAAVPDESGAGVWLVSAGGKLLEHSGVCPDQLTRVSGASAAPGAAGGTLALADDDAGRCDVLLALLSAAEGKGVLASVNSVDLSDNTRLRFAYLGRFTVEIAWDADLDYALRALQSTVDQLEQNETGTINLMVEGKASFIPLQTGGAPAVPDEF